MGSIAGALLLSLLAGYLFLRHRTQRTKHQSNRNSHRIAPLTFTGNPQRSEMTFRSSKPRTASDSVVVVSASPDGSGSGGRSSLQQIMETGRVRVGEGLEESRLDVTGPGPGQNISGDGDNLRFPHSISGSESESSPPAYRS